MSEYEKITQAGFNVSFLESYIGITTKPITLEHLINIGLFPRGTPVRFNGTHGYDVDKQKCIKIFGDNIVTVEHCDVGSSYSTYKFYGIDGNWNTVMFDRVIV